MSREAQLLFAMVDDRVDRARLAALAAEPFSWSRVAELAHREQALITVGTRVQQMGAAVPQPFVAQFSQLGQVAAFHLMHLQHRFEEVVRVLAEAGIPVVLLKGAGLAYTAYPSFLGRPMSDVDVLLHRGDARRAQELLGGLGWDWERDAESAEFYAHHHHLPPMFDTRGGGANLELHTSLFIEGSPLELTAESVWGEAQPVTVAGVQAFVPHPHHQLLHACLHFAWGHMMQSGAWRTFRDVAALARKGGIDWSAFAALAERSRGASACYWTFDLARTVGGVTEVPEFVLERLRPRQSSLVRERLRRHLALSMLPSDSTSPSVRFDRFMWELAIMPDHYGHGEVRPWTQGDRMVTGAQQATVRQPRTMRLTAQVRKVGLYTRYLRTLLTR